jgi:hypothetical protein
VQDITKRLAVTFSTGLPLGTHATFTHDKQLWIAVPADKYGAICVVIDRLIGALAMLQRKCITWLYTNPGDAERIAFLLETIAAADKIRRDAIIEKTEARTA